VAIGFMPTLLPSTSYWASEGRLTVLLGVMMAVAYGATLIIVDVQRRGGARGFAGIQMFVERVWGAIPRRRTAITSPDAALFWMEWRRAGLVLPAAVLVMTWIILGPVMSFTGHGHKATYWAEMWLTVMPLLLAFPIGLGFGKPDFWSLDLAFSPFFSTRPVSDGQFLAAKMKAAACSTLLAWAILLLAAPAYIYMYCDTKHWSDIWGQWQMLYFPFSARAVPIIGLLGGMLVTWGLLVRNIWLGYCGRPGFYYSITGTGLVTFVAGLFFFVWWQDHPRTHGDSITGMLTWIPWALAAIVTAKVWLSALLARTQLRRGLISVRSVVLYASFWLCATGCLMSGAWLLAPRIEWFYNTMMLVAMCVVPVATIVAAPLTIAWNRHQ